MTDTEFYKRRVFVANNSFEEAQEKGYLPEAAAVDKKIEADDKYSYYVVSYSRKDSRFVLPEIYDLQKNGFEIWYDHGIVDRVTHDNDWRKIVHDRIFDFHCRGVLFYISENFVMSPSIEEEVRMVRAAQKPHLEIVLPMVGGVHDNAFYQAGKIAEIKREQNSEEVRAELGLTEKRIRLYKKMFGDEINYIRQTSPIEERVAGLSGMKAPELFEFRVGQIYSENECRLVDIAELVAVNNTDIVDVEVPDKITLNNKEYRVCAIGDCVFANCRKLKHVKISDNVVRIRDYAFYRCNELKSIKLPNALEDLGGGAFKGCAKLKSIAIPWELDRIERETFADCVALERVIHDDSVHYIGHSAFRHSGIKEFNFADNVYIDSFAFHDSGLTVAKFAHDVKHIGDSAFSGCKLKQVELPFIAEISQMAFANNDSLEKIIVERVGANVRGHVGSIFLNCNNVKTYVMNVAQCKFYTYLGRTNHDTNLEITGNADIIEDNESSNHVGVHIKGITSIVLPNGLKTIGYRGLADCENLKSITIPHDVKYIENKAFEGCSELRSVTFGQGVERIACHAFSDCPIAEVKFDGGISKCVYVTQYAGDTEFALDLNDQREIVHILRKGYEIRITRG